MHIAPIVSLEGARYHDAVAGRTTRYARVDTDQFADLAVVTTVDRASLEQVLSTRTEMDVQTRQAFAGCISRRFARFAYPNAVVDVLRPLANRIRTKAPTGGATGQVLDRVVTMRLECEPDWEAADDLSLTLLIIVDPAYLPSLDEFAGVPDSPKRQRQRKKDLNGAAEAILAYDANDPAIADMWIEFGNELGLLLQKGADVAPEGYISDVEVEVMRSDEIHFERYRNSVDLDFDYLSPSG